MTPRLFRGLAACGLAVALATAAAGAPAAQPQPATPSAAPAQPKPKPKKAAVTTIVNRLDVRDPFNLGRGKVRIMAYLSPTCSHCISNAAYLQQEVLDKNPSPDIELHIVWMKILDTDDRAAIDRAVTVLHDPRAQHYWDPDLKLNPQLRDAIRLDVNVRLYDIFLLYGRDAEWKDRVPRPPFWMHEYRGAPGPAYDPLVFAGQVARALAGEPLSTPK